MLCFNGFDITCLSICCPCVFLSLNLLVSLICLPFSSSNLYLPLALFPPSIHISVFFMCSSHILSCFLALINHFSCVLLTSSPISIFLSSLITSSVFLIRFRQVYILSLPLNTSSFYISYLLFPFHNFLWWTYCIYSDLHPFSAFPHICSVFF